jgi:hypothetical protein
MTAAWQADYETFQKRDLSDRESGTRPPSVGSGPPVEGPTAPIAER